MASVYIVLLFSCRLHVQFLSPLSGIPIERPSNLCPYRFREELRFWRVPRDFWPEECQALVGDEWEEEEGAGDRPINNSDSQSSATEVLSNLEQELAILGTRTCGKNRYRYLAFFECRERAKVVLMNPEGNTF